MNFEQQQHMRLDFSKMLCELLKDSKENEIIRNNYLAKIAIIKESLKIPKDLPSSEEISKFFTFLKESHKSSKKVALKSFFIKTKVFLVWLISAYELFSQRSLENFNSEDWCTMASFLNIDYFKLKFKLFSYLKPHLQSRLWSADQDQLLRQTIKKLNPQLFNGNSVQVKVHWSKISYEMSKGLDKLRFFKTDKQCKERWFNHLNPNLNKNAWNLSEDIKLIQEFLQNSKKWAKITRKFPGRTQHQIKNRYFAVLTKELGFSREKINDFSRRNCLSEVSFLALDSLQAKTEGNLVNSQENTKKAIFEETNSEENSYFEAKDSTNSVFSWEMEFNIEEFINLQRDEPVFIDF